MISVESSHTHTLSLSLSLFGIQVLPEEEEEEDLVSCSVSLILDKYVNAIFVLARNTRTVI